ncbi:MAG: DNA cytosine methyltransferase [Bacteroidales bacterium]|nr:DNA cytosine methyltransferase [Bacteroidales bacterium]
MIRKGFKFIDLFCGIGGFHQAMTSLGGKCVFASDIDKECQKTYRENYGIEVIGDITKVDAKDIEPFNVLCAGFPCQAFSHAGKQLGFNDQTRGTLFFDVIRIAKHHKPEYMLLENVKNLAMHDNGHTWQVIYDTIQAAGYNVLKDPVIFSPHFIGLPQNRERVFIMCIRKDVGDIPEFAFDVKKNDLPKCSIEDILLDDSEIPNIEKYRINQKQIDLINLWDDLIKGVKCDLPGCPIYGEFLVPSTMEIPGFDDFPAWKKDYATKNVAYYLKHKTFIDGWMKRAEKVEMYQNTRRHLEWQTYRGENESMWNHIMQFRQSGLRVKRPTYFPALVAIVQTSILAMRKRYIVPRECARIQSFPDTFKINPDDHIAYKQFGNSVNVEVVKLFAKYLFGDKKTREKYTKYNN